LEKLYYELMSNDGNRAGQMVDMHSRLGR